MFYSRGIDQEHKISIGIAFWANQPPVLAVGVANGTKAALQRISEDEGIHIVCRIVVGL